jgi:putative alpha-1,2-mannosidase
MHGAVLRFTYPPPAVNAWDAGWNQTRRVLVSMDSGAGALAQPGVDADGLLTLTGTSVANSGGVPADFGHYFYATLGGGADGASPVTPLSAAVSRDGALFAYFDFDPQQAATNTLTLRIATSLISPSQAQANHAAEVAGVAFGAAVAAAKAAWHTELSRVTIVDAGAAWPPATAAAYATTFYSSLYRASKFPRALWELESGTGAPIHWSPYTNKVEPGVFSTDQGFWDAYRSTYSLLALWRPDRFALQMEGWLNAWREGGWVPQWSSPGYRGSMTGTMSDVTMSEAIVKLPWCGTAAAAAAGFCVNASALYAASRQNAFVPPVGTPEGRECLLEYAALGYVPSDGGCDAVVSRTLNYL